MMLCPFIMVIPILFVADGVLVAATPAGDVKLASVDTNQVDAVPHAPDAAER